MDESKQFGRGILTLKSRKKKSRPCSNSDNDDEDEFATKFIYNNGNNASTDNKPAGVAA